MKHLAVSHAGRRVAGHGAWRDASDRVRFPARNTRLFSCRHSELVVDNLNSIEYSECMEKTALRLQAHFTTEYSRTSAPVGSPQGFEFNSTLPTVEQAREFVALFPKSTKMFATTLSTDSGRLGYVVGQGTLISNGVNGGVNETGLRRYQTIIKAAAKLGIEIQYVKQAGNAYASREAFEAAID